MVFRWSVWKMILKIKEFIFKCVPDQRQVCDKYHICKWLHNIHDIVMFNRRVIQFWQFGWHRYLLRCHLKISNKVGKM